MQLYPRFEGEPARSRDMYFASSLSDLISSGPQVASDTSQRYEENPPSVFDRVGVALLRVLPVNMLASKINLPNKWRLPLRSKYGQAFIVTDRVRHDPQTEERGGVTIYDQSMPEGLAVNLPNILERNTFNYARIRRGKHPVDWDAVKSTHWNNHILLWVEYGKDNVNATMIDVFDQRQLEKKRILQSVGVIFPSIVGTSN